MRIVTLIILAAVLAGAAHADTLKLRASARVEGAGALTIADVCNLDGADALAVGDVVLVEDLGALLEREKWPEFTVADIRRAIEKAGRSASRVELSGSRCLIRAVRAHVPVEKKVVEPKRVVHEAVGVGAADGAVISVKSRVAGVIASGLGAAMADLRFRFQDKDRELLAMTAEDGRLIVNPVSTSGSRQMVRVRVMRGGQVVVDKKIRVEVVVRRDVVVVTRDIRRGEMIDRSALLAEERWVDPSISRLIPFMEQAAGWVAARSVREGDLLTEDDAEPPLMVQRRERVRVLCLSGGIGVEVWARAEEDGRMGEFVRLKREGSRDVVTARVTGRRTAVMDLDAGRAGGTAVARVGS